MEILIGRYGLVSGFGYICWMCASLHGYWHRVSMKKKLCYILLCALAR